MALREQHQKKLIKESNTPRIVYLIVGLSAILVFGIKRFNEELYLNLFAELIGAAFTLFVIDVLLVKAKSKRWGVVQKHIDYLIARNVNRLRDGLSTIAFSFQPSLKTTVTESQKFDEIRRQREKFLIELSNINAEKLSRLISQELFTDESYKYFNDKGDEFWNLLNMKYAEYFAPPLVLLLLDLHTHLKDLCSQITFYKKSEKFPDEAEYYRTTGTKSAAIHLSKIIKIVVKLKEEGYSEAARV